MYLFFDTETTGLPKNWKAPVTDVDNWPRLVQLAWITFNKDGVRQSAGSDIVKPKGFTIPEAASKIHGITDVIAHEKGKNLSAVLDNIYYQITQATILVGHNIAFDNKILGAEIIRKGCYPKIKPPRIKICTMFSSTKFCNIPGLYGLKWPSLTELHNKLFGREFEGAHDATFDIEATAKCFWELVRLGIIVC